MALLYTPLTVLMQVVRRKYKQIPIEEMIASRVFRRYPQHPHLLEDGQPISSPAFPPKAGWTIGGFH